MIPGTITVVSATRKVNRMNRVYVNSTVDVPIENQPQIIASGTGCTYDNNGNLTSDPSRGILDIEWSETGKPMRVSFVSGEEICYRYAATGEKLSEVFVDTDGRILRRRDIYGNYELTDGSLDRTQVGGGYLDSKGVFHVYVTDYQGNVIGIINAKTGTPVLFTDYYPYGIPHATAYSPEANRRKFGGKEYTSEFGFSSCDFGARLYSPLLCGFDSPDLKASTYTHISPYTYCAADPVNFIDPTGEEVILYATKLPGLDERYDLLSIATHTFIVVENKKVGKVKFAYGSEWDGVKGVFSGKLIKRDYMQDHAIMNGKDLDKLKARIIVQPPAGMTIDESDNKVIEVGNSFGNNPNISYYMIPSKLTEGNCNTSTSTILLKSGVSKQIIEDIKEMIPGIRIGFESILRPWTALEQEKAVKRQEIMNIFKDRD